MPHSKSERDLLMNVLTFNAMLQEGTHAVVGIRLDYKFMRPDEEFKRFSGMLFVLYASNELALAAVQMFDHSTRPDGGFIQAKVADTMLDCRSEKLNSMVAGSPRFQNMIWQFPTHGYHP